MWDGVPRETEITTYSIVFGLKSNYTTGVDRPDYILAAGVNIQDIRLPGIKYISFCLVGSRAGKLTFFKYQQ